MQASLWPRTSAQSFCRSATTKRELVCCAGPIIRVAQAQTCSPSCLFSTRPRKHQSGTRPSSVLTIRGRGSSFSVKNSAASSAGSSSTPASPSQSSDEIPKEGLISRLLRPLKDFGFGRKSFWEGGVGIFIFTGVGECVGLLLLWRVTFRSLSQLRLVLQHHPAQHALEELAASPYTILCTSTQSGLHLIAPLGSCSYSSGIQ